MQLARKWQICMKRTAGKVLFLIKFKKGIDKRNIIYIMKNKKNVSR